MKAKYLVIALFFSACFSFSQEKDPYKGWYVGPNVSYVVLDGSYYEDSFRNNMANYKYFNSYSAGLDGMYAFGRKHTLTFGVHYKEIRRTSYRDFENDTLSNPQQISNGYGRYVGKSLSLPVHMDFCLFKGKYSPYIITGIIPEIYVGSKYSERITYANGNVKETLWRGHGASMHLSWQVGFGLDVNLANKSKLRVFVYEYGYEMPFFLNTFGGWRFWDYSIHTGISYYLKTSSR